MIIYESDTLLPGYLRRNTLPSDRLFPGSRLVYQVTKLLLEWVPRVTLPSDRLLPGCLSFPSRQNPFFLGAMRSIEVVCKER